MKSIGVLVGALAVICLCASAAAKLPVPKQQAGPPNEFKAHAIPTPEKGRFAERSVYLEVEYATLAARSGAVTVELLVDSTTRFAFSVLSPIISHMDFALYTPSGAAYDLTKATAAATDEFPLAADNSQRATAKTFVISAPEERGAWQLTVRTVARGDALRALFVAANAPVTKKGQPDTAVLLYNEAATPITGRLNTYRLELHREIGLATWLGDTGGGFVATAAAAAASEAAERAAAIGVEVGDAVEKAEMAVRAPDGTTRRVEMRDDGKSGDLLANDGVYGALVRADVAGEYTARAEVRGSHADGTRFVRSTQHILRVVDDALELTGTGSVRPSGEDPRRAIISLNVDGGVVGSKYYAYAECYHSDSDTALAWIGGMTFVTASGALELHFDARWARLAGVVGGSGSGGSGSGSGSGADLQIDLRNVYVKSGAEGILVANATRVTLSAPIALHESVLSWDSSEGATESMRMGIRPAHLTDEAVRARFAAQSSPSSTTTTTTTTTHGTILLHGYCSTENPWSLTPDKFTNNPRYFLDKSASLPHDEFAMRVFEYLDDDHLTEYAGIGHSQGGIVLLHLLNHYWSGLDATKSIEGARPIQSVGTPWEGSVGAGTAANLAQMFGFTCGENFDLTPDGAALWQESIRAESREQVHFYLTTYKQGTFFGDYCSLATNLVLQWPNDGATSIARGKLDGGNDEGVTEKQCHTTDMGYMAQYLDESRNAVMNSYTKLN